MAENDRIAEIRQRLAGLSWLPWHAGDHWVYGERSYGDRGYDDPSCPLPHVLNEGAQSLLHLRPDDADRSQRNVEFVANAPTDVEFLLSEVDRLRAALATAEAEIFAGWSV